MKQKWAFMATLIMVLSLLLAAVPAQAEYGDSQVFPFYCLSDNSETNCANGEIQIKVELEDPGIVNGGGNPVLLFTFYVEQGPSATITEVYFDDDTRGVLELGSLDIYEEYPEPPPADPNDPYVDFVKWDGNPGDLNPPAGNEAIPPFETTDAFMAEAVPPPAKAGVDEGGKDFEHLTLSVVYAPDDGDPQDPFDDVYAALESGCLRIAVHVQNFPDGGSETFLTDFPSTLVELVSFGASSAVGGANIGWVTGSEVDNAGFNLYRSISPNGPFLKVNSSLIPAQGDPVAGASYSYTDSGLALGRYYYLLEDVDLYGVATRHGPVSAAALPSLRRPVSRPVVSW